MDRYEVFEGTDGQFYFRRVASNGEIVASSEGYEDRDSAVAEATRQASSLAEVEAD